MTAAELHALPSYQNSTFGGPLLKDRHLATRIRRIGPCPGCGRHEENRWWTPCPAADCPSQGPQEGR